MTAGHEQKYLHEWANFSLESETHKSQGQDKMQQNGREKFRQTPKMYFSLAHDINVYILLM